MNKNSFLSELKVSPDPSETSPILVIPYMWIGDFVRGHTVVRVLKERWPNRPVDLLVTSLCAPLVDYMPGVRRGFVGEVRFGLINDWRWGERKMPRFIDKNAALALPADAPLPKEWPVPQLVVPPAEVAAWRQANNLGQSAAVALAPGSVGASKRWTYYAEAARMFAEQGLDVWVVGGPGEKAIATEIVNFAGPRVRDLTGTDLRNGIMALAAAKTVISNDSGLMHIAAAIGTPAIGIFGPTSPYH